MLYGGQWLKWLKSRYNVAKGDLENLAVYAQVRARCVSPVLVWRPIRKVMAEKDDNRLLVEYLTVNWKDLKKRNEVRVELTFFLKKL